MVVLFLNFSFVNHHKVLRYFVFCFNSAIVTRMHRPSLFTVSGGSCLFSDSDLRLNKAVHFLSPFASGHGLSSSARCRFVSKVLLEQTGSHVYILSMAAFVLPQQS